MKTDVHQHLWPKALVTELRKRTSPPMLDGWTLKLHGEPDFLVAADDHDTDRRADIAKEDGLDRVLLSLSSPLGIEYLPYDDCQPLLNAFHEGALSLPSLFGTWASVSIEAPRPDTLSDLLDAGCVGLQLPATAMSEPRKLLDIVPLLEVLVDKNKPLFVHPGQAVTTNANELPRWWPPLVPYVNQMHAAWFSYKASIEQRLPTLRTCFAMLAGLAPLHDERCVNRGAPTAAHSEHMYVDTSSYGPMAIGAAVEAIGTRNIVFGSDRPYAKPPELDREACLHDDIKVKNVAALLNHQ